MDLLSVTLRVGRTSATIYDFSKGMDLYPQENLHIIQAPSEATGLGMKNWSKEIVCIMCACERGAKFSWSVSLLVTQLLPADLTNPAEIFWGSWGTYWLCIFQKLT